MNRRQFTVASLPAALLAGCHRADKPSRDATLIHNGAVRDAVSELDQAINSLDMQVTQFNAENWRDALASVETATQRIRNGVEDLKRSLGYPDAG